MGDFVLDRYDPGGFYCEMLRCPATAEIRDRLGRMPIDEFKRRAAAETLRLDAFDVTMPGQEDFDHAMRSRPLQPFKDGAPHDPLLVLR